MTGILNRARMRLPAHYLADGGEVQYRQGGGIMSPAHGRYSVTPQQAPGGIHYGQVQYQQHPWDISNFATTFEGGLPSSYTHTVEPVVEEPVVETTPTTTTTTTGDGTGGVGTGGTGAYDDAGNPAPYLGVDPYDLEGDDNFLTQDEYQKQVDIITNQYDSWKYGEYDPTKTFEEQLSAEDYEDFYNSSLGENPAQLAADTIYNNNQQIYGEETGNNVTSLVTGQVTNPDGTPTPGDTFEEKVQNQGEAFAEEAGSTLLPDGTYDISSWFNPTDASNLTGADKVLVENHGYEVTPTGEVVSPYSELHSANYDNVLIDSASALLEDREGFRDEAYQDHLGNWTIGHGITSYPDGTPVKKGDVVTPETAETLKNYHLNIATNSAKNNVDNFDDLSTELQTALISQAYQLGGGGQADFTTTLGHIENGNWEAAKESVQDSLWAEQTPVRVQDFVDALDAQITTDKLQNAGVATSPNTSADAITDIIQNTGSDAIVDQIAAETAFYEEDPFAFGDTEPVPAWEQAGYSSEYRYNDRLEANPWESSSAGIEKRKGWDKDGNYQIEYRVDGKTYDNYSDAAAARPTATASLAKEGPWTDSYNGTSYRIVTSPTGEVTTEFRASTGEPAGSFEEAQNITNAAKTAEIKEAIEDGDVEKIKEIVETGPAIVSTGSDDDDPVWASGTHWGGSEEAETSLITSDLSDDDFWDAWEDDDDDTPTGTSYSSSDVISAGQTAGKGYKGGYGFNYGGPVMANRGGIFNQPQPMQQQPTYRGILMGKLNRRR